MSPGPPGPPASRGKIASFGPYRLHAGQRSLKRAGNRVNIGSRAFDILRTLLEQAPGIVSKRDLIERVWGNLVVAEGSLHVHVAALRKRLRDGEPPGGYITNVPGRGYCFAGTVTWTAGDEPARSTLPHKPLLVVGRDDVVAELTARLQQYRFVSIVGAGGIGKTTVVLDLAHRLLAEFPGGVHFLDLAPLEDPRLLVRMLASQLGLVPLSEEPLPVVLTHLSERRVLLVFDGCERLVRAVAALTEEIFRDAPQAHILTTSREALRAEGEHVHHLPPLACPPADAESLTAAQASGYSAVQLFIKHVAKSGHALKLSDAEAPVVAEICRRLDGIALALELAASRVGVHGIRGTASLLDKHFRLLWHGRRTALPRHQTLSATLDWSYNLLTATEQLILRRLAVFVGGFSLEAALEVAAENLDPADLAETLATLIEKSLVILQDRAPAMRYRLLDTTRAYAWQKLLESGEAPKLARRHSEQLLHALERFRVTVWAPPSTDAVGFFASNLTDLRAALDWCFSGEGDAALGAKLTGAAACLLIQTGLLTECVTWTERALHVLDGHSLGTRLELELQACFASSIMVTAGNVPQTQTALVRALQIAESLRDVPTQFYLLHTLYTWQIRSGDLRGFKELTERVKAVAEQIADPFARAISHNFQAVTCFFTGDNRDVAAHAQIALDAPSHSATLNVASFAHLHRGARPILARNLWVLGFPDRALMTAAEAIREGDGTNHPFTICYVLMSCVALTLDIGEWRRAQELTERLANIASKNRLHTYARAAVGWQGCLAVSRGDLAQGIELLQTALTALHEDGYELYRPQLSQSLAEGLAQAGRLELAATTITAAVGWAESRGRILNFIDALRVRGEILNLTMPDDTAGAACLVQSLDLARERGLLSLELRAAIALARFWARRGASRRALQLLGPIFGRFSEGFTTRDLLAAAALLQELRSGS